MPFKSEEDRRAYQQNYKRERRRRVRAEVDELTDRLAKVEELDDLESLCALLDFASWLTVHDIYSKGTQRARGLALIVNTRVRVLDALDLHKRVEALEAQAQQEEWG